MTPLLDQVMEAHGGRDRWDGARTVRATGSIGGPFWSLHEAPGIFERTEAEVDVRTQRTVLSDYTGPGLKGIFTPGHVSIVDEDGRVVQERHNPLASFDGFGIDTPWDPLHLLFFGGYALWHYLTTPHALTLPGVEVRELEPRQPALDPRPGLSGGWRRLGVTFPDGITAHSKEQTYYFDEDSLQRRMDYQPKVTGDIPTVHMLERHREFSGLVFATRRLLYVPDSEGSGLLSDPFITLDFPDIRIS